MRITYIGKKENIVPFVADCLSLVDGYALTLTTEPTHPEGYCVTLVIESSDGTIQPNGCEKQPTTSTIPHLDNGPHGGVY